MTNNNQHILYSFRRCPYAMRARFALEFAGISYELREVDLKHKPQAMLLISPKATVPVLQLDNGHVLEESMDIVHWALSENYPADWEQLNAEQLQQANKLIDDLHDKFIPALNKFKYPDRYDKVNLETERIILDKFLSSLDKLFVQNQYLFVGTPCFADICVFPLIRQCWVADKTWFVNLHYKGLMHWFDLWMQHSIFNKIMLKQSVWIEKA